MFLLSLMLAASVTAPTDGILRLYTPHAEIYLDNVEADETLLGEARALGLTVLNHAGDDREAQACAAVSRARSLGIYAFPGMRIYHSADVATLLSPEWWQRRADTLHALRRCARVGPDDLRVSFDVEDYGPTAILTEAELARNGLDRDALWDIMAPFLLEASLQHLTGALYPFNPDDQAHALLARALASLEIWEEGSFGIGEVYTYDRDYNGSRVNLARHVVRYRDEYPEAAVRYGFSDSLVRSQGHRVRADLLAQDFGPLAPWVFRHWRNGGETAIGSRAWRTGVDRDSRNDIWQAWRVARRNRPMVFDPPALPDQLKKYNAAGDINNNVLLTRDGWALLPAGQTFSVRPRPYLKTGDFTLGATWRLEPGIDRGRWIWGAARHGTGSGDGHSYYFAVTKLEGTGHDLFGCALVGSLTHCKHLLAIHEGEPLRTVVTWNGDTLKMSAHRASGAARVSFEGADVSYPTLRYGQPRVGDEGAVSFSDDVLIARRAWTDAEVDQSEPGVLWPYNFEE